MFNYCTYSKIVMKKQLTIKEYFGLGRVPVGIGAVLNGWHGGPQSVLDFRAMTGNCLHDCFFCFTDKRKKTLALEEIKGVINQAADLGFKGIDYLGEGEPTLDKDFERIIEQTSAKGIVPVVFTDGATKLKDEGLLMKIFHFFTGNGENKKFAQRLYDSGASVCPKCDSLFNRDYQNWVVGDKKGRYFDERNEAIERLIERQFNQNQLDGTTRLGFDMVVTKRNVDEVEQTLRYCRDRNIFIVFSTYLPAGRCAKNGFDDSLRLSQEELTKMRETVKRVDAEYGFNHPIYNNFATFPCVEFVQIYGNGRVSPCPGNETVVGNIQRDSLKTLAERIREQFPCHRLENLDGNCFYRPR